eukprot:SAG31_NODE_8238_length_1491_cov_10.189655_1_plen_202_part_00
MASQPAVEASTAEDQPVSLQTVLSTLQTLTASLGQLANTGQQTQNSVARLESSVTLTANACNALADKVSVLPYMDDYIQFFSSEADALEDAAQLQETLEFLGLQLNPKKSTLVPTQLIQHLGLMVDTKRGLFVLPPEKEAKIRRVARALKIQALQGRRLLPAKALAHFTGLCQSVYLAVPAARFYLRALHDDLQVRSIPTA